MFAGGRMICSDAWDLPESSFVFYHCCSSFFGSPSMASYPMLGIYFLALLAKILHTQYGFASFSMTGSSVTPNQCHFTVRSSWPHSCVSWRLFVGLCILSDTSKTSLKNLWGADAELAGLETLYVWLSMPYDLSGASSKWNLCSIILTERFPRVIVTEAHPWIIFDMVLAAFYSWIWYLFSSLPEPGLTPSFGQVFVLLRYPKLSFCLLHLDPSSYLYLLRYNQFSPSSGSHVNVAKRCYHTWRLYHTHFGAGSCSSSLGVRGHSRSLLYSRWLLRINGCRWHLHLMLPQLKFGRYLLMEAVPIPCLLSPRPLLIRTSKVRRFPTFRVAQSVRQTHQPRLLIVYQGMSWIIKAPTPSKFPTTRWLHLSLSNNTLRRKCRHSSFPSNHCTLLMMYRVHNHSTAIQVLFLPKNIHSGCDTQGARRPFKFSWVRTL